MKIVKFGGNCVSTKDMYRRIAHLLHAEKDAKVVTVSAVAGITDKIQDFISKPRKEREIIDFMTKLRSQHLHLLPEGDGDVLKAAEEWIDARCTKLERLLFGITYTEELTPRTRDLALSFGERLSSMVVASNLKHYGIEAHPLESETIGLLADDNYGNASALLKESEERVGARIKAEVEAGRVPVITGYFGITQEGHVATFGRGGSDYSAAVLAYLLKAKFVEIWKDVEGFMSADPKIVSEAFTLPKLSYEEAAELAYFGAKVLHPRTVQPARLCGARILIKNIYKPGDPGTEISPDSRTRADVIKSVSYSRDLSTLKVYASGAGYRTGFLSRISEVLASAAVNVYSATTSQTCVALLIENDQVSRARKALTPLIGNLLEKVETIPDISLIAAVGEGLGYTKGVAARVFKAVASEGINVQLISAGASMVAYHFTVDAKDLEKAIVAIHREFFGGKHDKEIGEGR